MHTVEVSGKDLDDFLDFVEDQTENTPEYAGIEYNEITDEKEGGIGGIDLLALLVSGAIEVVFNLFIDYFRKRVTEKKTREITIKLGDDGPSITLNGNSEAELETLLAKLVEARISSPKKQN